MLTPRAWWLLLMAVLTLSVGLILRYLVLILLGASVLLWLGAEWVLFAVRVRTLVGRIRLKRAVHDERGPVQTLWTGRSFEVRVALELDSRLGLGHVLAGDFVPFAVERLRDLPAAAGPLGDGRGLGLSYRIHCVAAGVARFEGVRLQVSDLHGLFYHAAFLHEVVQLPILPLLGATKLQASATKENNTLLPPGLHRLARPGPGSELLDLRDYRPGDPPKTIAWKASARRNRLITKEFESEVPVRCTLFVDTSASVRVPSLREQEVPQGEVPGPAGAWAGKPLHRLIDIAATVLQASVRVRDLPGLVLVDDEQATAVSPGRSGLHLDRMLRLLASTSRRNAVDGTIDPEHLAPLAHSFALEVYPALLQPPANGLPFWLPWLGTFPFHSRHRAGLVKYFHRKKWWLLLLAGSLIPLGGLLATIVLSFFLPVRLTASFFQLYSLGSLGFLVLTVLGVGASVLLGAQLRRMAGVRKRLAAFLSGRYQVGPGALEAFLEDDDLFSLWMQRFLNDHQVPYGPPLYDEQGRYRFAGAGKVEVIARGLLQAVRVSHDNEMYILLVDLLDLDDRLDPLLRALRVARSRHHHLLVVCPWPPGVEPPGAREEAGDLLPSEVEGMPVADALQVLQSRRLRQAYYRLRRRLARLGVELICAADREPVALILDRIDRLRRPQRRTFG